MSDQQAEQAPPDPALVHASQGHALRIAVREALAEEAAEAAGNVRQAAAPDYAVVRNAGHPAVDAMLPDGTKLGKVSIYAGAESVRVDEDLLILCAAPGDLETYVLEAALHDDRVVKLLDKEFPEFVGRRIKPRIRRELQAELENNDGRVRNRMTGDPEQVAVITRHPANGRCAYKPEKDARQRIRAAIGAGLITEDGEIPASSEPEPEPVQEPETAPEAIQEARELPPVRQAVSSARNGARTPTDEQAAVIDAFRSGGNLVVEAGAGTGKTSTLVMCAEAAPAKQGTYIAYNKAIATDAKAKFPGSVSCSTAHALAMGAVGYEYRHRLNGSRIPAREQARILNITSPVKIGDKMLAPERIARLAGETVALFCRSAADEPRRGHVPRKPGLDEPTVHSALADVILPLAERVWADLRSPDGRLKFSHDHYLKMWQLTHPKLSTEVIFFDEAQDANPVILDVVLGQRDHAQLVAVGDRNQAINGWNGAVDAMDDFPADIRLALSQSFRFGPAIARQANLWLGILGADLRLRGTDRISSMIRHLDDPAAILCRTNAEAMSQAMKAMEAGRSAAIVGGGDAIRALADAAMDLQAGRGTSHPELFAFNSWAEVQDYAENDTGGSDLRVLVSLIDEHGPDVIRAMVDRLTDEKRADVVLSTAHKSKGREWTSVKIAADFREPRQDPERPERGVVIPDDLAMLIYVAVTRAQLNLDPAGVAWGSKFAEAAA